MPNSPRWCSLSFVVFAFACGDGPLPIIGGPDVVSVPDAQADASAPMCELERISLRLATRPTFDKLDLLLMIDNSRYMVEEQASFAAELPALIEVLTTGVARDGVTFPPLRDIRIGVVTSDMGVGGNRIATCEDPAFGDDGLLQRSSADPACVDLPVDGPPFLALQPSDDAATLGVAAACLASTGSLGCGFEQPLEALLKAVTPMTSTVRFVEESTGHGDTQNQDFIREDSVVAIVMLTDEDDCSAANPDLYNQDSTTFPDPDLNLRCWRYGDEEFNAVHPVERYVEGLLGVIDPERLVYSTIAGVPVDLADGWESWFPWSRLVGNPSERDPRLLIEQDPSMPSRVRPSCGVPVRGDAYPPERLLEVAQGLNDRGATVLVESICASAYTLAIDRLADAIVGTRDPRCVRDVLPIRYDPNAELWVVEDLPSGATCGAGRVLDRIEDERVVCHVCQVSSNGEMIDERTDCQALGDGAGWYFDPVVAECPSDRNGRINFLGSEVPASGTLRVELARQCSSFPGNPLGCGEGYVCFESGEIEGEDGMRYPVEHCGTPPCLME